MAGRDHRSVFLSEGPADVRARLAAPAHDGVPARATDGAPPPGGRRGRPPLPGQPGHPDPARVPFARGGPGAPRPPGDRHRPAAPGARARRGTRPARHHRRRVRVGDRDRPPSERRARVGRDGPPGQDLGQARPPSGPAARRLAGFRRGAGGADRSVRPSHQPPPRPADPRVPTGAARRARVSRRAAHGPRSHRGAAVCRAPHPAGHRLHAGHLARTRAPAEPGRLHRAHGAGTSGSDRRPVGGVGPGCDVRGSARKGKKAAQHPLSTEAKEDPHDHPGIGRHGVHG